MSEFEYRLKINAPSQEKANQLAEFINTIKGVQVKPNLAESVVGSTEELECIGEVDFSIPLGAVVRAWREHRNIKLTSFAKKVRMSKGYISSVELGKIINPSEDVLTKLAHGLGITTGQLMLRRLPPVEPKP